MKNFSYRLGLDVGSTSLGWSVLALDKDGKPVKIKATGARIFSDGRDAQDNATLKAKRRQARSARRNRDRFIQRRLYLLEVLKEAKLFPKDEHEGEKLKKLNPLKLRVDALDKKLLPYHIGRALLHINQGRGFLSNRKDRQEGGAGPVNTAVKETKKKLEAEGFRTLGEFLLSLYEKKETVRFRPTKVDGQGNAQKYHFFPSRDMFGDEFDKIWQSQKKHYLDLMPDALRDEIRDDIIFCQRPLKAATVGYCVFMEKEKRGAKALPTLQWHRIYQELNNFSWQENGEKIFIQNEPAVYEIVEGMLLSPANQKGHVKFSDIKKRLQKAGLISKDASFYLAKRDDNYLLGDQADAVFGGAKSPVREQWKKWNLDERDEFVMTIIKRVPDERIPGRERYQKDADAAKELVSNYGLSFDDALACVSLPLPAGYAALSKKAASLILKEMRKEGKPTEREAVKLVADQKIEGFKDPSEMANRGGHTRLRYYGEVFYGTSHIISSEEREGAPPKTGQGRDLYGYWGGITNATVHIALNQLRHVVNELIGRYGIPESIGIELGRNLSRGAEERNKISALQKERNNANAKDKEILREKFKISNPSPDDVKMLRLWNDFGKACAFCRKTIGCAYLFGNAGGAQKEHLVPKKRGGGDGYSNLAISCVYCNQKKNKRFPYEAFGEELRIDEMPKRKQWLFRKDAPEVWEKLRQKFLERDLNDTRYIARLAKFYLGEICPDRKISVVTGKLTHYLRQKVWRLGGILRPRNLSDDEAAAKNRNDHRHHAIDAIVIGMTTRSIQQEVSAAVHRGEEMESVFPKQKGGANEPWEGFRNDVVSMVKKIVVSHKVKTSKMRYELRYKDKEGGGTHSKIVRAPSDGQLHNDTAYGLVSRKPVSWFIEDNLTSKNARNRILKIRDAHLQNDFLSAFDKGGKEGVKALAEERKISLLHLILRKPIAWFVEKKIKPNIARDRIGKIRDAHLQSDFLKAFDERGSEGVKELAKERKVRFLRCHEEDAKSREEKKEMPADQVVSSKPISWFKTRERVLKIRDAHLCRAFSSAFDQEGKKGVERLAQDLKLGQDISLRLKRKQKQGIRSLRCVETVTVIPIKDKRGREYKAYAGASNWGAEIYEHAQGHDNAGQWHGVVISQFDAHQPDFVPGVSCKPHPAARLVMRLHIDDCIRINAEKLSAKERAKMPAPNLKFVIMRVQEISQDGNLSLAALHEANVASRNRDKKDSFAYFYKVLNQLKKLDARKVCVSAAGRWSFEKPRKK